MKLSIITVNLNNREGLKKTIDSVVSQTFKDFEWIVIDGGSTDGSKELIEQYADHFAYWVSEPDKGIYNAMNKGIKEAKGEYLQFLNSGDWLCDETALTRCFSHEFTSDIAYGDLYSVQNNGTMEKSNYPKSLSVSYFYHYSIGHNASFIRRDLLLEDLYDEKLKIVSDWAFYLKQALKGRHFEWIDEVITCFDTMGISSVNGDLRKQEWHLVIKDCLPEMLAQDSNRMSELLVQDFNRMGEMQALLDQDRVKKVIEYSKKKNYRKMITACLSLIGFVDWLLHNERSVCFRRRNE